MPLPTPLHSRTSLLNQAKEWREWAGYFSAISYQKSVETEYFAIRNAAGLLDVSPLFKYEIKGPDAKKLVNRIMTRNMSKCKVGQIMYGPWCDEQGFVIDEGTIARLDSDRFRITAAEPNLHWFKDVGFGMDAQVSDISTELAALALQGPNSRSILNQVFGPSHLDDLKYYRMKHGQYDGSTIEISRTGYTGDLGFELWIEPQHALKLWDAVMEAGQSYGILPVGLAALDMARVEAGLLLLDVDYTSSRFALIEAQKSNPYELGLGWAVDLKKNDFVGRRSLLQMKDNASNRQLIGLEISWLDLEREFGTKDLPPQVTGRASRDPLPIFVNGQQVGQATTVLFSPILKKYIALATVSGKLSLGSNVQIEATVEYERRQVGAIISKLPFYNPKRKRAIAHA